ncbi:MAG: oxidoreductase [Sterolibacterium sp.]
MLTEKVVVVTGGAGLLGRRFCAAIAAHGGIAIVADRSLEIANSVARDPQLPSLHGRMAAAEVDITDTDSVCALVRNVKAEFGHIDAVVNTAYPRNANYGRRFEDVGFDDFCANVSSHLGGYFLVSQQFAEYFKDNGGGHIISLSSIYGVIAPRFEVYEGTSITMPVEYAAIKSAVIHLTRYIARYYRGTGVRSNCISPGGILDGQPDSFLTAYNALSSPPGMLSRNDVNGLLVFLLSDGAAAINGQNLVIDNGFSL